MDLVPGKIGAFYKFLRGDYGVFWSLNKKRVRRIFRSNFVPGMLALSATAVFLVILAYIFL